MRIAFSLMSPALLVALSIGCAKEGQEASPNAPELRASALTATERESAAAARANPAAARIRAVPVEARVPDTLAGPGDCAETKDVLTACEWRSSVDALVLGKVRSVRLVTGDAFVQTPDGWEPAPACKDANPALALQIDVEQRLAGTAPAVIEIMVGSEQVQRFRPLPLLGDDGELVWAKGGGVERGPLQEGRRILVGIQRVGRVWSLAGGAVLGVDGKDIVHAVKRTGDCMNLAAHDLDGVSIKGLQGVFAACTKSADGQRSRAAQLRTWGARPVDYYAATCTDPLPEGSGDQVIDAVPIDSVTQPDEALKL